jgi:hypothetical protein
MTGGLRSRLVPLIAASLFIGCIAQFYDARTGFTSLIGFGDVFEARTFPPVKDVPRHIERQSTGYDGQFYAQMATDPLLRDPALDRAMDDAPLRARRILFSWTAYAAGLGQPSWIVQAYAVQNIACWLVLGFVLLYWFPATNARMLALWFVTLFAGGLIWSVRAALLDGPSLLLLALGMLSLERGRPWLSAIIFGISGLGRETNLLSASAHVGPEMRSWNGVLAGFARLVIVVLPLLIWFDYIHSIHRSLVFTSGETLASPFVVYLWKWQVTLAELAAHGWSASARFSLLAVTGLSVQALYFLCRPSWTNPWWRLGLSYTVLMAVLGRPLWEGDPGTALRVLLPMTLAFNVLIRRCENPYLFWILLVAGNLSVVHGLWMLDVPFLAGWL